MRYLLLMLAFLLVGCTTPWQKHTQEYDAAMAAQDYERALEEQRWLLERSFQYAPQEEQGTRYDMDRYLNVARLSVKLGNVDESVDALRQALQIDPHRYREILEIMDTLPLDQSERRRLNAEFRWNLQAMLPTLALPADDELPCWSYVAREIRVQGDAVHRGLGSSERRISYDARTWRYDADRGRWRADGDWLADAGAESVSGNGPPRARVRALEAANGGYLVDGGVPPCHRREWTGPYDVEHQHIFVARQLPQTTP